jgi:hypothetical protein
VDGVAQAAALTVVCEYGSSRGERGGKKAVASSVHVCVRCSTLFTDGSDTASCSVIGGPLDAAPSQPGMEPGRLHIRGCREAKSEEMHEHVHPAA